MRQLSDEERRWFYEAVESQVEDEGERMKQGMLVLASQATDAGNVQRHIDAVEDLEDLVAQIDLAKTFVKLEGMGILPCIPLEIASQEPGLEDVAHDSEEQLNSAV